MGFYIPIYAFTVAGQQQFGAHLNQWAFNAGYPELGQVFDLVDSVLQEEFDDLGYEINNLKLFYHHPQDQQFYYFWDNQTRVSFEDKLPYEVGVNILSQDPIFIIEVPDMPETMPHILFERP
ncbi:hypothetical protein ACG9XS_16025 [Acinetobacter gyllenbergii]|uniref:hypothetical protein n=1 Tax=Acinetobacter gyllenbergii TaxID=134534 RepID=UPI003AF901E3